MANYWIVDRGSLSPCTRAADEDDEYIVQEARESEKALRAGVTRRRG